MGCRRCGARRTSRAVQFLAEQDPEAVLRQFGPVPRDSTEFIGETEERRLPPRLPDLIWKIGSGDDTWIAHVEFQTRDDPAMDQRMMEYMDVRRELVVRFVLLGSLPYDTVELLKLVEKRSMMTLDDLRESSFYQFILQEGREEGRMEGRYQGEAELLRRLIERRFGPLPPWAVERITGADHATVEAWADRLMDANGMPLEDLLA